MNNRQEELDKLKNLIAGEKEVDWKSITRKVNFDPSNPLSLRHIDPESNSNLDAIMDGMFETNSDLELRNEFIKDLQRHSEPGKSIFTYRALKSALLEMKFRADELCSKVKMTKAEFIGYLQETVDKIDNLVVDMNVERYEEAQKLLADEAGFEELKQLQIEYHKAVEVLALEGAINDQKKLQGNTINLLSLLHRDGEDRKE